MNILVAVEQTAIKRFGEYKRTVLKADKLPLKGVMEITIDDFKPNSMFRAIKRLGAKLSLIKNGGKYYLYKHE